MALRVFCCSFDPRENKWSALADMTTACALAGCTIYRDKIYVIGTQRSDARESRVDGFIPLRVVGGGNENFEKEIKLKKGEKILVRGA